MNTLITKLKNKICVALSGENLKDLYNLCKKAKDRVSLIELRFDYLEKIPSENELLDLKKLLFKNKVIATARRNDEGGRWRFSEEKRIGLLKQCSELFDFVDIELKTFQEGKIKFLPKARVICSYHNFEKMPEYKTMESLSKQMNLFNPYVKKFAVMVKREAELKSLFRFLLQEKGRLIVLGMGEEGKVSRILTPILGGFLTYVSFSSSKTAPGQISLEEMERFFEEFGKMVSKI